MKLPKRFKFRNTLHHAFFIGGLFVLFFHVSCQQAAETSSSTEVFTSDENEEVKAIKYILKNIEETWNQNDLEFFNSILDEDLVTIPFDRPSIIGKTSRVQNVNNFLEENENTWNIISIDKVLVSGGLAVAKTKARDKTTPKATGETYTMDSEGLFVFKKDVEGNWKMIFETWNNPAGE